MQEYGWNLQPAQSADASILASIGGPVSVLLIPLGFGTWQLASASITGFIAKENVVGTIASVYAISNFANTGEVASTLALTPVAALACMMFNLFTPPCFAAIGAMNAELKSKKWLLGGIGLQLFTGYTVAFLVYQIGTLITTGAFGNAFVQGLVAIGIMVAIIIGLVAKAEKR